MNGRDTHVFLWEQFEIIQEPECRLFLLFLLSFVVTVAGKYIFNLQERKEKA